MSVRGLLLRSLLLAVVVVTADGLCFTAQSYAAADTTPASDAPLATGIRDELFRATSHRTPGFAIEPQASSAPNGREFLLTYRSRGRVKKYFEWALKDGVNLATRPGFWNGQDRRRHAIGGVMTIGLFSLDSGTRNLFQDHRSSTRSDFLNDVEQHYYQNLDVASGVVFLWGLIGKREGIADTGFLALESMYYGGRISALFKGLTHRERPRAADDPFEFHGPGGSTIDTSSAFISGHATTAFAFAAATSEMCRRKWITGVVYSLSTLVAIQRLDENAHWLSDVVGGAMTGRAVGKRIVRFHYPRDNEKKRDLAVTPILEGDVIGVHIALRH